MGMEENRFQFFFLSFNFSIFFYIILINEMTTKKPRLNPQSSMVVVWNRTNEGVTPEPPLWGRSELYISIIVFPSAVVAQNSNFLT